MKIRIIKDFDIAHDGMTVTSYKEGQELDILDKNAARLIECNAAVEVKADKPVTEKKVIEPVAENKTTKKRTKKSKK